MTNEGIQEKEVLAALPPPGTWLHEYVNYASFCTDAPAAYHLGVGLTVLAQTVPVDLHLAYGTPMPGMLYSILVGRSSESRKSAAILIGRKLLEAAIPTALGEVPGSKESLVDSLGRAPRQLICYPEFGSFLSQAERGYMNPLKTAFTEVWDGTPQGRSLVKRTGGEAKTPRLSMIAASTAEYLERHTEPADWTGGFMARWLCFFADRQREYEVPPGWPQKTPELVAYLQQLDAQGQMGGPPRGEPHPDVFDAPARRLWREWYGSMRAYQERSVEETAGAIARTHAHALRMALLFAWDYGQARSGYTWRVTRQELEPALGIAHLHVKSVLRVGQTLASSPDMRNRRSVLKTLPFAADVYGNLRPVPVRLGQIVEQSKLLKYRVQPILESLLEEGLVTQHLSSDVSGAWYRRTTPEEYASAGRPNMSLGSPAVVAALAATPGTGAAAVAAGAVPPAAAPAPVPVGQVIQLAPYLVAASRNPEAPASHSQESSGGIAGSVGSASQASGWSLTLD